MAENNVDTADLGGGLIEKVIEHVRTCSIDELRELSIQLSSSIEQKNDELAYIKENLAESWHTDKVIDGLGRLNSIINDDENDYAVIEWMLVDGIEIVIPHLGSNHTQIRCDAAEILSAFITESVVRQAMVLKLADPSRTVRETAFDALRPFAASSAKNRFFMMTTAMSNLLSGHEIVNTINVLKNTSEKCEYIWEGIELFTTHKGEDVQRAAMEALSYRAHLSLASSRN